MFTDKFKVLLGLILFLLAFAGLFFNQLTLEKQVVRLNYDVQGLTVRSTAIVEPTATPTATPTALLKFAPVRKVTVQPTK